MQESEVRCGLCWGTGVVRQVFTDGTENEYPCPQCHGTGYVVVVVGVTGDAIRVQIRPGGVYEMS